MLTKSKRYSEVFSPDSLVSGVMSINSAVKLTSFPKLVMLLVYVPIKVSDDMLI
jgi:hypothetical protein